MDTCIDFDAMICCDEKSSNAIRIHIGNYGAMIQPATIMATHVLMRKNPRDTMQHFVKPLAGTNVVL